MNILVCIKQVPDDSVEIHLNADGAPDLANVTPVVNAFDTYALEMAARLKESGTCFIQTKMFIVLLLLIFIFQLYC